MNSSPGDHILTRMPPTRPGQPFATTARWIAAARARETRRTDCLFSDPYAELFAGEAGHAMLARSEEAAGGENRFLPVRTRHFDDALLADMQQRSQVVLLGAGYDTRAYRLPLPVHACVIELDRAELLAEKEAVLNRHGAHPRCDRRTVSADLAGDWASALLASGYDRARPTTWIAEGVLFYLPTASVSALLRDARACSAAGSLFLADVFGTGLLATPAMQGYLQWLKQAGKPLPFCTDDPEGLFTENGWQNVRMAQPGAPEANYGRFAARAPATQQDETHRTYLVHAMAGHAG